MERDEVLSLVRTFLRTEGLILPRKPLKEFYAQIFRLAGFGIGGLLTLSGKKAGEMGAQIIKEMKEGKESFTYEEICEFVGAFLGETRIAFLKERTIEEGKVVLSFEGSLFAEAIGSSRKAVCLPVSGALSGLFTSLTGERWNCKERDCKAKGDSLCTFELTKR